MADPNFEGYNDPNFRQAGVKSAGKLLLGRTHAHNRGIVRQSTSSIPSKFETLLYTGDVENDGFMSRTTRLKPELRDIPGPGVYWKTKDAAFESKSDSFSKKGFGGLCSNTRRFSESRYRGPGPGTYTPKHYEHHYHRSQTSRLFKSSSSPSGSSLETDTTPGPCDYHPMDQKRTTLQYNRQQRGMGVRRRMAKKMVEKERKEVQTDVSAHTSSAQAAAKLQSKYIHMMSATGSMHTRKKKKRGQMGNGAVSRSMRNTSRSSSDNSGVDAVRKRMTTRDINEETVSYGVDKLTQLGRLTGHEHPFGGSASRFRTQSEASPAPGQYNINTNILQTGKRSFTMEPSSTFKSGSMRSSNLVNTQSLDNPGPGEYTIAKDMGVTKANVREQLDNGYTPDHISSAMFKSSMLDRFGKPLPSQQRVKQPIDPGPGHYSTEIGVEMVKKRLPGASGLQFGTEYVSKALSRENQPPGPAYYNPEKNKIIKGRSFHLNTQGRWMGR